MGQIAFNSEGALGDFALGKHGIAMAHQQDRLFVAAGFGDQPMHGIAIDIMRLAPGFDAVFGEVLFETSADGIDTFLVEGAGIDVHDVAQQVDHRLLLGREPVDDLGFGSVQHELSFGHS